MAVQLVIFREIGDRGGEEVTLENIGFVYEQLDDSLQAISFGAVDFRME